FVQDRGSLRRELTTCLHTRVASRQSQGRDNEGQIQGMVISSNQPADAKDRAAPGQGHWDDCLFAGLSNMSATSTLMHIRGAQTTHCLMFLHLPHMRDALAAHLIRLLRH